MNRIILDDNEYELITNYKNGFDEEELKNRFTDYFDNYDYVVGDWAYNKLRLKGFCNQNNELCNKINDYRNLDDYIKNQFAYECKYFVIKKVANSQKKVEN